MTLLSLEIMTTDMLQANRDNPILVDYLLQKHKGKNTLLVIPVFVKTFTCSEAQYEFMVQSNVHLG
jgi:hypothetical protein